MAKLQGREQIMVLNAYDKFEKSIQQKELVKLHQERGTYDAEWKDLPPFPAENDYIYFPFRHLSATIVGGGSWKATDFSNEKVLKAGYKKLNGKPAYKNHWMVVGEEIGIVKDVTFTPAYTNANGEKIPAGIDGPFVIDSKLEPKLVRRMTSPHGSPIQSASVSVLFDWEASHDFENENDFYYHIGEMVEGSMVRRVVVEIIDFYESSLVWLGADPYAKMLVDGEVVNIDRASVVYNGDLKGDNNFNKIYNNFKKFFVFDCREAAITLDLKKTSSNASFAKPTNDNMDFQELVAKMLGIPKDQVTPEMLQKYSFVAKEDAESFKQFQTDKKALDTQLQEKVSEIATLKKAVDDKDKELGNLLKFKTDTEAQALKDKPFIEYGQKSLENDRKRAKELYSKFVHGKTEKAILDEIETSTTESLNAKIEMWGGKVYEKFGAKCVKCGSNEFDFRSSVDEEDPNKDKGKGSYDLPNLADMVLAQ
jgi:hypothetical protein